MSEALTFAGCVAVPTFALVVHRAGLVHSVRVVGSWWFALAVAIEAFRAEFRRLSDESRKLGSGR